VLSSPFLYISTLQFKFISHRCLGFENSAAYQITEVSDRNGGHAAGPDQPVQTSGLLSTPSTAQKV